MEKWWKVQEPGDSSPKAVLFLGEDWLVRRYVPGEGLVDWPEASAWIFGTDLGAKPIGRAEALKLIAAGVGRLPGGIPSGNRAPTIAVPD